MARACTVGLVAAGLLLARPALGQRAPLEIGPVLGLNIATLKGVPAPDPTQPSSRTGFELGVAATHPLSGGLGLETALLYATKGALYNGGVTVASSYIEIPVRISYTVPLEGSRLMPRLVAGPYVGLETGCRISASGTQPYGCSQNFTDKSFDYGVGGGAGLGVPMGRGTLDVTLRYDIGLTDVWSGFGQKNRVFGIAAAYLMPVGKGR